MASDEVATFPVTVGRLVEAAAVRFGSKDLLVDDSARITFAELDSRSRARAAALLADGVTAGARVALLAPNSVAWLVEWCALTRIGVVAVMLNTFLRGGELIGLLRQAGASRLHTVASFLGNDYLDALERAVPELADHDGADPLFAPSVPMLRSICVLGDQTRRWTSHPGQGSTIDDGFVDRVQQQVSPADPAVVVFTSGSTGPAKGVVHTHGAIVRYSRAILESYRVDVDDVVFSSMPFFWAGGLGTGMLPALHAGATVVTQAAFRAAEALELLEREHVTVALGWPQQGRMLAAHPDRTMRDLSAIRRTTFPDLVEPHQRAPEIHADTLGMTETFGSHSNYDAYVALAESKRGTSGPALPGMQRQIVDPVTGAVLPAGEVGEICVRGDFLTVGVLGRERAELLDADGWLHTGDMGRLDAQGWIYFAGRRDEMIKTAGGANVTPGEVEAALGALPGVLEAHVVGVAGADGESVVGAAVVARPGAVLDPDALRGLVRRDLSAYKVPRTIVVVGHADLPALGSGKIDRDALAEQLGRALSSAGRHAEPQRGRR